MYARGAGVADVKGFGALRRTGDMFSGVGEGGGGLRDGLIWRVARDVYAVKNWKVCRGRESLGMECRIEAVKMGERLQKTCKRPNQSLLLFAKR